MRSIIIGFIFDAVLNNKIINLYNQGKTIRDFIYIDDLSNLIKLCIEAEDNTEKNNIYNIGSNIGYSILDLLEVITQITSKRINYIDMPARIIDCDYNVLDITKIKKDLN